MAVVSNRQDPIHDHLVKLEIDPGTPILLLKEVFYNQDGYPIVMGINYYNDRDLSLHGIRPWHPSGVG